MFQSLNGGSSRSAINTGLAGTGVNALAIDPTTPTTLYSGTSGVDVAIRVNGRVNSVLRSASLITGNHPAATTETARRQLGFSGVRPP